MKEYTILEAAAACGVTKNTVKYRLKKLPADYCRQDNNGVWFISEEGLNQLKNEPRKEPPSTTINHAKTTQEPPSTTQEPVEEPVSTTQKPPEEPLVNLLQDTIKTLQAQLEVKDRQISDLTAALQAAQQTAAAAQALHAGTMKQLEAAHGTDPEPVIDDTEKNKPAPAAEPSESEPEVKRSWWSRFFGMK